MGNGGRQNKAPAIKIRLADLLVQKNVPVPGQHHEQKDPAALKEENAALKQQIKALELQLNAASQQDRITKTADALHGRGVSYLKQALYLEAAGRFFGVLALNPEHLRAKINLAVAFAQLNKTGEAVKLLKEVLATDPDSQIARQNLEYLTSLLNSQSGKNDEENE